MKKQGKIGVENISYYPTDQIIDIIIPFVENPKTRAVKELCLLMYLIFKS